MKKILALVVAVLMIAASISVVFAEGETYKITVPSGNDLGHDSAYVAYQIFTGSQAEDKGTLGNIQYGANFDLSKFITAVAADDTLKTVITGVTASTTAAQLAGKIEGLTTTAQKNALAHVINDSLKGTPYTLAAGSSTLLPAGYYLIVDTTAIAADGDDVKNASLLQLTSNITVAKKTDKPSGDKKIDGGTIGASDAGDVKYNNASVGDTVPFIVTSTVPDMTYYIKYYMEFADTLSPGFDYINTTNTTDKINNGVKVKIGETVLDNDQYTVTVDETNKATAGTKINIVFNDLKTIAAAVKDADIVITYSATVNQSAVIGEAGNPNTLKIIYSNNPEEYEDGTGKKVTGETPDSTTKTFISEFGLLKRDGLTHNPLANAEFTLTSEDDLENIVKVTYYSFDADNNADPAYYALKNGTYTTEAPDDATKDQYVGDGVQKYAKTEHTEWKATKAQTPVAAKVTTGPDGIIKFTGLKAGTYTLTETGTPEGYNSLEGPITFTLTYGAPAANADTCDWTASASYKGENLTVSGTGADTANIFQIVVDNNQGNTLPETGGMGTTILYIGGSVLVILAAVLLITKRRMNAND